MAYGLRVMNSNGWLQIDQDWQGLAATNLTAISSSNINPEDDGIDKSFRDILTGSVATTSQLYVRPDYTSWTNLISARGTTGDVWFGVSAMRDPGAGGLEWVVFSNMPNLNWSVLWYDRMSDKTPASTGDYALEVYKSNDDLAYSSIHYAPLAWDVVKIFTDSSQTDLSPAMGSSEKPPWIQVNGFRAIITVDETDTGDLLETLVPVALWRLSTRQAGLKEEYITESDTLTTYVDPGGGPSTITSAILYEN